MKQKVYHVKPFVVLSQYLDLQLKSYRPLVTGDWLREHHLRGLLSERGPILWAEVALCKTVVEGLHPVVVLRRSLDVINGIFLKTPPTKLLVRHWDTILPVCDLAFADNASI